MPARPGVIADGFSQGKSLPVFVMDKLPSQILISETEMDRKDKRNYQELLMQDYSCLGVLFQ